MFKLLIGYDGSDCADDALNDLHRAGLPDDNVEALLLAVADVWPEAPGPDYARVYPKQAEQAQRLADAMLADARLAVTDAAKPLARAFPGWSVRGEAVGDSPYWGLVMKAQQWQADLLVVGSHGRGAIGRLVLGSVSQNAVLYADCSVRIGRCRADAKHEHDAEHDAEQAAPPTRPVRILIGWDGSPDAERAVRAVARRSWPRDSECRLVTAVDARLETLLAAGKSPEADAEDRDALLKRAATAAEELRNSGLLVGDPLMDRADPKDLLVREADSWRADCIFVGAKGLSRIQRVLLGSVSAAVAARAKCSVEIVRSR